MKTRLNPRGIAWHITALLLGISILSSLSFLLLFNFVRIRESMSDVTTNRANSMFVKES